MSEPQKRTDRDAARGEFSTVVIKKKKNSKITSTAEHIFTEYPELKCPQHSLDIFSRNSLWLKVEEIQKRQVLQPQKASVVWQTWECPESQTILAVIELLSFIMASLRLSDLKHEGGMCYRGLEGTKRLILFEEETAANHQTPHTAIFPLPFPHSLLHSSPNKELYLL